MTECKDEHILNSIDYPEDLRKLSPDKLGEVCAELRQYIIDVLSENPGHLGASLGTVELTVALHYVFNTPYDRIVWDVGHQAYGHKILTGCDIHQILTQPTDRMIYCHIIIIENDK